MAQRRVERVRQRFSSEIGAKTDYRLEYQNPSDPSSLFERLKRRDERKSTWSEKRQVAGSRLKRPKRTEKLLVTLWSKRLTISRILRNLAALTNSRSPIRPRTA